VVNPLGPRPTAVRLSGRLGNQLFQFAACRAIQGHAGPTIIDSGMLPWGWRGQLDECLRPGLVTELRRLNRLRVGQLPSLRIGEPLAANVRARYVYREAVGHGFDARIRDVKAPALLVGYFNDERYFLDDAADVRAAFRGASPAVHAWMEARREEADGRPLVAVGFRHADDYASLGWALPPDYYRNALDSLELAADEYAYVVFGDAREPNMSAARALLGTGATMTGGHDLSVVDQLNAMAMFETLIIPNSTFSWWGAWLADFDHGHRVTVMAPDPWVYVDNELIPNRWTKIQRSGGLVRSETT
jgi:hypothetical protein